MCVSVNISPENESWYIFASFVTFSGFFSLFLLITCITFLFSYDGVCFNNLLSLRILLKKIQYAQAMFNIRRVRCLILELTQAGWSRPLDDLMLFFFFFFNKTLTFLHKLFKRRDWISPDSSVNAYRKIYSSIHWRLIKMNNLYLKLSFRIFLILKNSVEKK